MYNLLLQIQVINYIIAITILQYLLQENKMTLDKKDTIIIA